MGKASTKYIQVGHTADIAARIFGGTLNELFENAAFAMFDMMGPVPGGAGGKGGSFHLTLEAEDPEMLLVNWLNELLYLSFSKKRVFSETRVDVSGDGGSLEASAGGVKVPKGSDWPEKEIKAATFHDVEIVKTGEGYEVTVVFDV